MSELEPPTKVLMIVWNGIEGDSRVQKSACTLAQAGYDVTLVGVSLSGSRRSGTLGQASVIIVPTGKLPLQTPASPTSLGTDSLKRGPVTRVVSAARKSPLAIALLGPLMLRKLAKNATTELDRLVDVPSYRVLHVHDYTAFDWARALLLRMDEDVTVIYDAHEYLRGVSLVRKVLNYFLRQERWMVRRARAIITVSPPIARQLVTDYGLSFEPTVVRNTPQVSLTSADPTVRAACHLEPTVPLVVYSGGITPRRGIRTLLEAVQAMPGVHLAVVAPSRESVAPLLAGLESDFLAERLHIVPFVAPGEVAHFLATADVCVHPLWTHEKGQVILNHAWALPNKWFEYIQARVPVVVSDVEYLSEQVRTLGIGEVFRAEDVADLQGALSRVLGNRAQYAAAISEDLVGESTWQVDGRTLLRTYSSLLGKEEPHLEEIRECPLVWGR